MVNYRLWALAQKRKFHQLPRLCKQKTNSREMFLYLFRVILWIMS
jgi:hypothetical protein